MIRIVKTFLAVLLLAVLPARAEAGGVGIGLDAPNDWGTAQPFLDLMKTARPWIGHGADEWQVMGWEELRAAGVLDEHGWPTRLPPGVSSIGTLLLTDLPPEAGGVAGRYVVTWDGTGEVDVGLLATNQSYGPNRIEFDYLPGSGTVHITIESTDPAGTGDYVRNIKVLRKDRVSAYAAGEIFNPDWLARIKGFKVLRFMDWMHTNGATLAHWDDRPLPDDVNYGRHGVPIEVMIQLANTLDAEPWFNMPHLADDDFVRRFAEMVKGGLDPGLRAWVEYSNEVWNWDFEQAHWADEQAQAIWRRDPRWLQFYGGRASEVADIWAEVFGSEADDRLMRVISTQTGWLGLEEEVLEAPRWVRKQRGRTAPGEHFDAYAITGYFGGHLGLGDWVPEVKRWITESRAAAEAEADARRLTGTERADFVAAHKFDEATARAADNLGDAGAGMEGVTGVPWLVDTVFPYHAEVAAKWGLDLVAYEGGTHVVSGWEYHDDDELTAFFVHLNYSPEMAALYTRVFEGWKAVDADVFVAFLAIAAPGVYGSWGHLRHLGDENPRWDALVAARDGVLSK